LSLLPSARITGKCYFYEKKKYLFPFSLLTVSLTLALPVSRTDIRRIKSEDARSSSKVTIYLQQQLSGYCYHSSIAEKNLLIMFSSLASLPHLSGSFPAPEVLILQACALDNRESRESRESTQPR
jgi:hypothetical protein